MLYVYHCPTCGNLRAFKEAQKNAPICCGAPMDYVKANSVEAAVEKHLPAVTVSGNKVHVQVGSVLHPMEEAHFIQYILLETDKGFERKVLHPGMKPEMDFEVKAGEKPVAAYEYCTKHGLWMSEIK